MLFNCLKVFWHRHMLVANKLRPPLRKFGGQGCCEVPCGQVDHPLCITIRESHNIRQLYHDRSLDKFAPATSAETAPPGLLEFLAERVASSSRISGSIIPAPLQAGQSFCLSRAKPHSTRAYTARRNSETRDLVCIWLRNLGVGAIKQMAPDAVNSSRVHETQLQVILFE